MNGHLFKWGGRKSTGYPGNWKLDLPHILDMYTKTRKFEWEWERGVSCLTTTAVHEIFTSGNLHTPGGEVAFTPLS